MPFFLIFLILLAIVAIYYYNSLVSKKNKVQQYWSNIDIVLKKRHNLIPNLKADKNFRYLSVRSFGNGKRY